MIGGSSSGGGFWGPAGLGGGSLHRAGRHRAGGDGKGFGETPAELSDGVMKILASEPEWDIPTTVFSHQLDDRRPDAELQRVHDG